MKKINGFYYDVDPVGFKDYKYRAKFEVRAENGSQLDCFDIYTTNPSRNEVEKLLKKSSSKTYSSMSNTLSGIIYWATKEQDDSE